MPQKWHCLEFFAKKLDILHAVCYHIDMEVIDMGKHTRSASDKQIDHLVSIINLIAALLQFFVIILATIDRMID